MDYILSTLEPSGKWHEVISLCALHSDDKSPEGLGILLNQVVGQLARVGRIKANSTVRLSYGEVAVSGTWDGTDLTFG